jgi:hypothetical protein
VREFVAKSEYEIQKIAERFDNVRNLIKKPHADNAVYQALAGFKEEASGAWACCQALHRARPL